MVLRVVLVKLVSPFRLSFDRSDGQAWDDPEHLRPLPGLWGVFGRSQERSNQSAAFCEVFLLA